MNTRRLRHALCQFYHPRPAPPCSYRVIFVRKSLARPFQRAKNSVQTPGIGRTRHRRPQRSRNVQTVVTCYSVFDKLFPACGLLDYTEGIYHNDPNVPYEVAQQNQIDYLLDEMRCTRGGADFGRGCGNGMLLETARRRGTTAVGITISPEQVDFCRSRGLDVRLVNYRAIPESWNGTFDAVVANGSMEHFVQPGEAARNRTDELYRQFFYLMHRLLDPASPVRRLVNTTIHFLRPPDPADLARAHSAFHGSRTAFITPCWRRALAASIRPWGNLHARGGAVLNSSTR